MQNNSSAATDSSSSVWTLYPDGFSAERFIEVIETEAVWDEPGAGLQ